MMSPRDLSNSKRSSSSGAPADFVLRDSSLKKEEKLVSREEAFRGSRIVKTVSGRDVTRVLFISQDTSLLNPTQQSLDGYLNVADLFDEVHILLLRTGIPAKNPVLRVDSNVWIYTASAQSWWRLPMAGIDLAEEQMMFATGFRPDLIVARDPFESALVGKKLSEKYKKPLQVHILENYISDDFKVAAPQNFWRRFIPNYALKTATSLRAETEPILHILKKKFITADTELLPQFHTYESLITNKSSIDLPAKYQQFSFFFLYIGQLGHESTFYKALDAARFVLKNPKVGLLVIGDGPTKSEFLKRAQILGVEKQVIFENKVTDVIPYLKSAQVLIVTDTDAVGDDVALQGAAAGIPLVLTTNENRITWFENNVSALLSDAEDVQVLANNVYEALNNSGKRSLMIQSAQDVIRSKFHQDIRTYQEAYRASIEEAIFSYEPTDES